MRKKTYLAFLLMALMVISVGCGPKAVEAPPTETPPPATETPAPEPEATADVYLVGEDGYTPISYMENGEVVGISPDIIKEAFNRMGMTVKLELLPWERCKQMALDGTADGFFSPYKNPDREKVYQFVTDPLMVEKNVFVVKKDSPITFDGDVKKLADYTVGTLTGYATLEEYIKDGTLPKVDYSTDTAEALKKLTTEGRGVDLYVNTNYIVWYNAKQLGLSEKIKELETPLGENPSYLAFTKAKDMSAIAGKFEEALKAMKADGTYDKIFEKYVGAQ